MAIASELSGKVVSLAMAGDNEAVTINPGTEVLLVNSGNATATNRTLVPAAPTVDGQQVLIVNSHASNNFEIADSSSISLDANGTFTTATQGDSLRLVASASVWYEVGRMLLA